MTTFDLEDDTVMSYCMYIVRQLNLTYPPTNWTEAKDLFSKINERSLWIFIHNGSKKLKKKRKNKIKSILWYSYLNNYFDDILAVIEALEYQLKHNMLKVSIKDTGKSHLKWYFNTQFYCLYIVWKVKIQLRKYINKFWYSYPVLITCWEKNDDEKITALLF